MNIKQIDLFGQRYNIRDAFCRDTIANYFDENQSYEEGDFVLFEDSLYKCLSSCSGAWDSNNWLSTTVMKEIKENGGSSNGIEVNEDDLEELSYLIENGFRSTASYTARSIHMDAFNNCTSLQSISFPNCISIGSSAFYSCTSLQLADFPNCTFIDNSAFYNCSSLQSVNFPNCTSIGSYAFRSCTSLQSISFPNCTFIGTGAFWSCGNLKIVSFLNCAIIGNSAFYDCRSLSAIYLLTPSVCTLSSSGAFMTTPIANSTYLGYFGSIYVPSSLVDSYKVATNWTIYSDRIVGI